METVTIGLTVKEVKELNNEYVEVVFDKTEPFHYRAGMHGVFELTKSLPTDKNSRVLTFMSHPDEDDIRVAFKKREPLSEYKSEILSSKGDVVRLSGPFGGFTWEENAKPVCIITSGIGASVLMSLLKEKEINQDVSIIDGTPEGNIFKDQVLDLSNQHKNVSVSFEGSTEDIKEHLNEFSTKHPDGLYYISGIMPFIGEMTEYVKTLGVEEENMRFERYKGYTE